MRRHAIGRGVPAGATDSDGAVSRGCGRCCTHEFSRPTAPLHAFCCVTCRDPECERHTPDCTPQRAKLTAPTPAEGNDAADPSGAGQSDNVESGPPATHAHRSTEAPAAAPKRPAERPAAPRPVRRRTFGLGVPAGVANSDGLVSHSCGRCCTRGCSRLTAPLQAFCCVTCRDSEGEQHTPDCEPAAKVATSPAPPPPDDDDDIFIDDGYDDDEPSAAPPPNVALPPPDGDVNVFIDNGDDEDDESSAAAPPTPPDQQEQSGSDVEVTGVIDGDLAATVPTPAVLALDQAVLEGGFQPASATTPTPTPAPTPASAPPEVCSMLGCCRLSRLRSFNRENFTASKVCCLECCGIGDSHSEECNAAATTQRRQQLARSCRRTWRQRRSRHPEVGTEHSSDDDNDPGPDSDVKDDDDEEGSTAAPLRRGGDLNAAAVSVCLVLGWWWSSRLWTSTR